MVRHECRSGVVSDSVQWAMELSRLKCSYIAHGKKKSQSETKRPGRSASPNENARLRLSAILDGLYWQQKTLRQILPLLAPSPLNLLTVAPKCLCLRCSRGTQIIVIIIVVSIRTPSKKMEICAQQFIQTHPHGTAKPIGERGRSERCIFSRSPRATSSSGQLKKTDELATDGSGE